MPLAACSPAEMLNAVSPRVPVMEGLAYAEGPRFKADVYAPERPAPGRPMVVFYYGGGWEAGERGMYRFLGAALASQGIVTVIPDYRVWPEVSFPGFMEDAAKALAWARGHAREFGGDPDNLFLMGHSAGAQIAALLALDLHYQREAGIERQAARGVIGISGPYDFLPLTSPVLKQIFGPEEAWPASQPINFVTPEAPPMLLATGDGDSTVDPANTTRLSARLRAAGVAVTERHYPRIGHAPAIGAMAGPLRFLAPVRRDALDFIEANTRLQQAQAAE
ncbi:alpha/beta hydrolase [Acetobacteraceae bacterium H6797]|nr:alpha/beta hydrolase [Acetobacteraceae bacterium H6797]